MPSCSSISYLKINYKVPEKINLLEGKKVFLEIRDSRSDKDVLGEGAKADLKNLSDSISLSITEGNEKGFKIGLFPLKSLMQEVFKERLKSLGLEVVTDQGESGELPYVVIDLQSFKLDLVKTTLKSTWTATMAYNVEISKKGKVLAGNKINGESERMKIIQKKEADTLLSELITDLANRLDGAVLFKQAGII